MNFKTQKSNQQFKMLLFLIGLFVLFLLFHMLSKSHQEIKEITFSEFLEAISLKDDNPNKIIEVTFQENNITGKRQDQSTFKTYGPNDADIRNKLLEAQVKINFKPPQEDSWWKSLLINLLPMIFLLLIFFFLIRQLQIGGGKALSFGKSKARLHESTKKITFKDVAGIDEAKEEVQEIIEFLKDPKKFIRLGARIPKGILLVGPPGTGKTLLAKAIAGEAQVPFFSISGSEFVEMFVGVGASRVRDMFDQAKKNAPCIVFIDEIDAVGRYRGAGLGGGHDEREQTLNQLLVEMDGFEANEGVIIIAATNRVDVLDPALLRPGRFDRKINIPLPDVKGREAILNVHSSKVPLDKDINLKLIAQSTPGFSGADLENIINEAALLAAKENISYVTTTHLDLAKDKILMGTERKSMFISDKDKRITAYHEAGHALVAKEIPYTDPIHKVTIIPRGPALGVTVLLPMEDKLSTSKEEFEAIITYAMGGRAAEEIVFNHFTTGASNDIKKATQIARNMVCQWGMSEKIGPVNVSKEDTDPFVGREIGRYHAHSEKLSELIDVEIQNIINKSYKKAKDILMAKRPLLDKIAEALIIKETLLGTDIDKIIKGEEIITDEDRELYKQAKLKSQDKKQTSNAENQEKQSQEQVDSKNGVLDKAVLNPLS